MTMAPMDDRACGCAGWDMDCTCEWEAEVALAEMRAFFGIVLTRFPSRHSWIYENPIQPDEGYRVLDASGAVLGHVPRKDVVGDK